MTPQQTEIVKASIPFLRSRGEELTKLFYSKLFAAHPELTKIFDEAAQRDGTQASKLAGSILAYAANIDNLAPLSGAVDKIACRHVSLKVSPEQYPIVGKYLLESLKSMLGESFTPAFEDAWSTAYQELAKIMIRREAELSQAN